MKPNEALEKIYLYPYSTDGIYEVETKPLEGTVEYTRTDVFIEKAWDWIEDNLLSSNQQDKSRLYLEQFENYMKRE